MHYVSIYKYKCIYTYMYAYPCVYLYTAFLFCRNIRGHGTSGAAVVHLTMMSLHRYDGTCEAADENQRMCS